jgi:hypothetical protein
VPLWTSKYDSETHSAVLSATGRIGKNSINDVSTYGGRTWVSLWLIAETAISKLQARTPKQDRHLFLTYVRCHVSKNRNITLIFPPLLSKNITAICFVLKIYNMKSHMSTSLMVFSVFQKWDKIILFEEVSILQVPIVFSTSMNQIRSTAYLL